MSKDIQEDLLRLAGFEEEEMSTYLPEWRKTSEKLRLTEDSIKFAVEEWIPAHLDTRLRGVRMSIGGVLRGLIDLMKADEYKERGYKLVYGIFPSGFQYFYALKLAAPDKVFVSNPDAFIAFALGILFYNNMNQYLDEAEKCGISRAGRHCPASKCRYAAHRWGVLPSPHLNWIWGFSCDNAPKADEFIQVYYNPDWKTYFTRMPHDQSMAFVDEDDKNMDGVKETDLWRVEYLANEMRESFEAVQKEIGIKVKDETLMEAHEAWRTRAMKMAELNQLLMASPKPVGGVSTSMFSLVPGLHFNVGSDYMDKALDVLIKELKQRVAKKVGILPENAPKLMYLMGTDSLPWIVKMFEDNGVRYEHPMFMPRQAAPPTYEDPFMATAEAQIRGGSDTGSELAHICRDLKLWGADGMVFGFYDFDRYLGGHQRLLARMVEERTGVPTFYIEGNAWEDRDYTPEALRTKIESICEILKMRKS
jgi:hypothetical protein